MTRSRGGAELRSGAHTGPQQHVAGPLQGRRGRRWPAPRKDTGQQGTGHHGHPLSHPGQWLPRAHNSVTARFGGSSGFASPRTSQGTVRGYLNVIDSRASVTFSKASLTVSLTLAMTLPAESSALIV